MSWRDLFNKKSLKDKEAAITQLEDEVKTLQADLEAEKEASAKFETTNKEYMGEEIEDYKKEYKLTLDIQASLRGKQTLLNQFFELRKLVDQHDENITELDAWIAKFDGNLRKITINAGQVLATRESEKLTRENKEMADDIERIRREITAFLQREVNVAVIYQQIEAACQKEQDDADDLMKLIEESLEDHKEAYDLLEEDLGKLKEIIDDIFNLQRRTT